MASEVGWRWRSTPRPMTPRTATMSQRHEEEDQRQAAHRLRRTAWGVGASDWAQALPSFRENVTDESI